MGPIRLNLSALRNSLSQPALLPDAPSRHVLLDGLLSDRPVSRRTAVQVTGGAVAGFVPVLKHAHAFLGGLELVGDDRRLAFVLRGRERWVIDVRRFAGSPVLRHRKSGDGVRVELSGARFPGTALPADFTCEVSPDVIGHRMSLRFKLGGFRCAAAFEGWLRGNTRARSAVSLNRRVCRLGKRSSLTLSGRARAEFSPDWVFKLTGSDLAALAGIGRDVSSDTVTLALAGADAPSVLKDPADRRTLITLERSAQPWVLRPKLRLERPAALRFTEDAFDVLTVEAGETKRGRVRRALIASGNGSREAAFFEPGGGLLNGVGEVARVPLHSARYAVAFDRTGEQRALLAEYGKLTWVSGDGFTFEVGAAPEVAPFEVVTSKGRVERMRCEPSLLRLAIPVAGALAEPIELPPDSCVALAETRVDGEEPRASARLCFADGRRCTGLVLVAAPPLTLLRPTDLLSVRFQFINLGLLIERAGRATLVREATEEAPGSFIVVHFAPQNIGEQAFYERAAEYDDVSEATEEPRTRDIPVDARIAGASRLAFRLPADMDSLPYTLDALLDWSQLEPSLVATALPPPPPPPELLARAPMTPARLALPAARAAIATDVSRRVSAAVVVDAGRVSSVADELEMRSQELGVRLTARRLEAIAATLTQTRPGYRAVAPADVSAILPALLRPSEPASYQTALETPWRLVVSPNRFSAWAHSPREVTDSETGITELWHTRLGVKRAGTLTPEASPVDEEEDYYRTLRAVWSIDYFRDATDSYPPHYPDRHAGNPFRTSLDARDRHELVVLTSDFALNDCEERIVRAERLMLSALGSWMNTRGAWDLAVLPAEAQSLLSLEEWRHRATMGRDHYVRVVYRGYLFPLGQPASLVKVTERKFKSWRTHQTAFLRQRFFVVVRKPEKNFPAVYQPNEGRKFPFRSVRVTTLVTPSLDRPEDSDIDGRGQDAFWLKVGGEDFPFHVVAEDSEGQSVEFTTPLAFIDAKFSTDYELAVAAAESLAASSAARRTRPLDGQKVAYAESGKPGDTSFETASLTFGAQAVATPTDESFRASDQPRFYPTVEEATVEIPAVKYLAGAAGGVSIKYPDRYLERGFEGAADDASGNNGQIFAELLEVAELVFGGGSAGTDNVGALVTPNLSISGLSRLAGPISGDLDEFMKGSFDPSQFFGFLDAEILGGVSLLDIVEALAGDLVSTQLGDLKDDLETLLADLTEQVTTALLESLPKTQTPAFLSQVIYEAAEAAEDLAELANALKVPKQIQLVFKWDPKVKSWGPFVVNGDPEETLTLTAIGIIPISLDGTAKEPSYTVSAKLQNFILDLFGIISIEVASVRFKKEPGEKPDVKADIADVEFTGPLAFVNELQDVIPSNGFVDAAIDILPTGLKAGFSLALPTIGVGVFTLDNMSLGGQLSVPFTGDPLRFRFNFCTREQPFTLTVFALGGGGYFSIELGLDGVELLEAAFEFGASLAVDFGVASGGVSVKAGMYFTIESDVATLTGYFRLNGHVDVLGLISASILLYLALTYQSSPEMVWGEATITIEIEILFFSASVDIHCRKEFTTPLPPHFEDLMNADEWVQYQLAFAA